MAVLIPTFLLFQLLRIRRRALWHLSALLGVLFSSAATGGSAPAANREYQIKAVFLYNFVQFVEWPASVFAAPDSPFVIGVLGENLFGDALHEVVSGEKVGARSIEVRRYGRIADVDACHILFISRSETGNLPSILVALDKRPILTVGDTAEFARHGGMIRLIKEDNRIRLRVNLQATKAAGLVISSKLLRAADLVGR